MLKNEEKKKDNSVLKAVSDENHMYICTGIDTL